MYEARAGFDKSRGKLRRKAQARGYAQVDGPSRRGWAMRCAGDGGLLRSCPRLSCACLWKSPAYPAATQAPCGLRGIDRNLTSDAPVMHDNRAPACG